MSDDESTKRACFLLEHYLGKTIIDKTTLRHVARVMAHDAALYAAMVDVPKAPAQPVTEE